MTQCAVTYDSDTGQLKFDGGGNLTVHNANGCAGFIANGDRVELVGLYNVVPPFQINLVG